MSATSVDPGPLSLEGEAHIVASGADAGGALRAGADLSAVPSAYAPRRVAVSEAHLSLTPVRALRPCPTPHVDRRAPRRRIPRMTVDHRVTYLTARSDLAKLAALRYLQKERVGKSYRDYPTDRLTKLARARS